VVVVVIVIVVVIVVVVRMSRAVGVIVEASHR
jgi:hypothetical protein